MPSAERYERSKGRTNQPPWFIRITLVGTVLLNFYVQLIFGLLTLHIAARFGEPRDTHPSGTTTGTPTRVGMSICR